MAWNFWKNGLKVFYESFHMNILQTPKFEFQIQFEFYKYNLHFTDHALPGKINSFALKKLFAKWS